MLQTYKDIFFSNSSFVEFNYNVNFKLTKTGALKVDLPIFMRGTLCDKVRLARA